MKRLRFSVWISTFVLAAVLIPWCGNFDIEVKRDNFYMNKGSIGVGPILVITFFGAFVLAWVNVVLVAVVEAIGHRIAGNTVADETGPRLPEM